MTNKEFSDGFDVLINSYSQSIDDPLVIAGLNFDEYEKSLFLTQAEEQLVKALYKGGYGVDAFEETEEVRRQLSNLVKQQTYKSTNKVTEVGSLDNTKDKYSHIIFKLPSDCWYIIYEQVTNGSNDSCLGGMASDVVPVTHDVFNRTCRNPFRGPNNNRVIRLDRGEEYVELVSSFSIGTYIIRYLKRPSPIILVSLEGTGVSINKETKATECELSDLVHQNILEIAVKLAIASRVSTTASNKTKEKSDDD